MFAIVTGVVWIPFFYFYHYRTLSVSEQNLQNEFQTSKYLRTDDWDRVHLRHSYDDEKQLRVKNGTLSLVRDTYHISNHVKENSRANDVQSNGQFYTVIPPVPKTVHNDSHIRATDVHKDSIQQHQHSSFQDVNDAAHMLPEWLRFDPSVRQLLSRQNISRPSLKLELLDELWTTAKPVRRPLKPVSEPLLVSGHRLSGYFEVDVRHSADKYKQVVVSVIDSGFTNFAINFQRLSVDTVGLQNFLFVCIDREAVMVLQQQGIACTYYHKSAAIQVTKT